jgi:hypothetical protein
MALTSEAEKHKAIRAQPKLMLAMLALRLAALLISFSMAVKESFI